MLFEKTEKVIEEEAKNKETLSEMKEDIKNKIPKVKQLANIILN